MRTLGITMAACGLAHIILVILAYNHLLGMRLP